MQCHNCCSVVITPEYSLGRSLSLHSRTLTCSHTAICSPGLPFNGLRFHNSFSFIFYQSFTETRRWFCLRGWPIADSLLTKWSSVNRSSSGGREKSTGKKDWHTELYSYLTYCINLGNTATENSTLGYSLHPEKNRHAVACEQRIEPDVDQ